MASSPSTTTTEPRMSGSSKINASLIINPYSSGMTARREREIVRDLKGVCDLEVCRTERPGHAVHLATEAMADGTELIIACGGDGTANEILNGLELGENTASSKPSFALIPAGGTNVFCRSLGMPNHPVKGTKWLVDAIGTRRRRTINLGQLDERLFLFAAGIGIDGEIVKRIEQRRNGRRPSDAAHVMTIMAILVAERFRFSDRMTVTADGGPPVRSALVMCGNTTPMSYFGRYALHFMPEAQLEGGLDAIAPKKLTLPIGLRAGAFALGMSRGKQTVPAEILQPINDAHEILIDCDEPQPVQTDGEYIGDRTKIRLSCVTGAINLIW